MTKFAKRIKLNLHTKIALLIILVISISLINTAVYIARWRISDIRNQVDINIMNIARVVASAPVVRDNLGRPGASTVIQDYVKNILGTLEGIEVIVVVDMNDIRYAHPNPDRVGQKFVGGDENRVLARGESYTSEAEGTLGHELRAFVPVYDSTNTQVGFVMVGQLTESYIKAVRDTVKVVAFLSFLGLIIGVAGALVLAKNIRNTLFGLEPEEISRLFLQREAILDAMHEGIIAIDEECNISLINDSALKLLGVKGQEVAGKSIHEIFPDSRLAEIMTTGNAEYSQERLTDSSVFVTNRVPIKEGKKIIGAIATFNDKTEVSRLAEEITGVRLIVDALRANTHEFMNKLHVILGLIELGELSEAKKLIINETVKQQDILNLVMGRIKEPAIAGLILGKISRAKELGVNMGIEDESSLGKGAGGINISVLITILGNLLDNAMEALNRSHCSQKNVSILICQSDSGVKLSVKDTGPGIDKEDLPRIFDKGYTTKGANRGRGLYLVKECVENLSGKINVASEVGKGTEFEVYLPKGGIPGDQGTNS